MAYGNSREDEFDKVEPFYKQYGIYIVSKSGKMGVVKVCDSITEVIVPIEYDQVKELFKNAHLLVAIKSGKFRIIKVTKNNTNLSPFYDRIIGSYVSFFGVIQVNNGNYVGLVNGMAEEVVPVEYDLLDDRAFYSLTAEKLLMKKNGKWGVLASTGEVLLPFEYDEIDRDSIFYRIPEYKLKNNKIITPCDLWFSTALIPIKKNDAWGLVDSKLKLVVPCVYRAIRQDTVNKLKLVKKKGHDLLLMTMDGPKITITPTEKLEQYSTVRRFKNGFAIVRKDKKYGFIDEKYDEIAPCIYEKVLPFECGCAIVKKDGKYGFIDETGAELTSCVYDEATPFSHYISIVRIGDLYGAVNNKGKVIIPMEYQILADLTILGSTIILMAVKGKKFGAIDTKNNLIVPFEYDLIEPIFFGMIIVSKNGKKGVFNKKGKLVVPVEFDEIRTPIYESGTYSVCNDSKWGVLNNNGERITQLIYDKVDDSGFACGRMAVCREGKWGFINRKGQEVIECIYDEVFQFFEENHCEVKLDGKKVKIDIYGNRIK